MTQETSIRHRSLKIIGPFCAVSCCNDVNFEVFSTRGVGKMCSVGKITKQWSGFAKEAFTDADNFGVTFPLDLDVKIKAVMLGAVFLMDFLFFEEKNLYGIEYFFANGVMFEYFLSN